MKDSTPGAYAIVAARAFDGEAERAENGVVIRDGTITSLVRAEDLPEGMPRHTFPGGTIIPGLLDAHVHFMEWQGPFFLAHGITAVRDVGNGLEWILARREVCRTMPWPLLRCTGPLIEGPHPIWSFGIPCVDQPAALAAVRRVADAGVDAVKLYASVPADWIGALVAAVHGHGLQALMHCGGTPALAACGAGIDEFFHLDGLMDDLWPDHPPGWLELWGHEGFGRTIDAQKRAADKIRELGVVVTPTLAYFDARSRPPRLGSPENGPPVPDTVQDWMAACFTREGSRPDEARWSNALEAAQKFVGLLVERGVAIHAGTDAPCEAMLPGLSLWREMALLAASGMGPVDVLRAATSEAASRLGLKQTGRIMPGFRADTAVVRGNPCRLIPDAPEVLAVTRGGLFLDAPMLRDACLGGAGEPESDPIGAAFVSNARRG